MKESLKMLIRRRAQSATDSDPVFRAFIPLMSSCSRFSNVSVKDSLILPPRKGNTVLNHEHEEEGIPLPPPNVEEEETEHQINLAEVMSSMQQHPPEPLEIDEPIRCPAPEPSIIQDNRALRGQRRLSTERSGQLRFLSENEIESLHETSKHAAERSRDSIVLVNFSSGKHVHDSESTMNLVE